jgi:hypothetical protein
MPQYDATFEIDSKTDSYAALRMLEHVHDAIREESQGSDDTDELLQEFRTLRDAATSRTPGRLTITYEQYDGDFEE